MKPTPRKHFTPTILAYLLSALGNFTPNAQAIAGRQLLMPTMNFQLVGIETLFDIREERI